MVTNTAGVVVAGSFAFVDDTIAPNAGVTNVSYVFTPVDAADFNSVTGTIYVRVVKATAQITLSSPTDFAVEYNGSSLPVTATTEPAGLAVDIKYNGSTQVPINVGNYWVTAEVVDNNYYAWASLRMMIYASGSSSVNIYPPNVANNVVQLPILGVPNTIVNIYASDDLVSWTQVGSVRIPATGYTTFTDLAPAGSQGRYYRYANQL